MTTPQTEDSPITLLQEMFDAWNRHDIDGILRCFHPDGVLITGEGTRFQGHDAIRQGVEAFFARFPGAQWSEEVHFVSGDRAVTEWIFTADGSGGDRVEMIGCDVFTLREGKILVKNAYRKPREG